MTDKEHPFTREEQIALMEGAAERHLLNVDRWSKDPEVRKALGLDKGITNE